MNQESPNPFFNQIQPRRTPMPLASQKGGSKDPIAVLDFGLGLGHVHAGHPGRQQPGSGCSRHFGGKKSAKTKQQKLTLGEICDFARRKTGRTTGNSLHLVNCSTTNKMSGFWPIFRLHAVSFFSWRLVINHLRAATPAFPKNRYV